MYVTCAKKGVNIAPERANIFIVAIATARMFVGYTWKNKNNILSSSSHNACTFAVSMDMKNHCQVENAKDKGWCNFAPPSPG